MRLRTVILMMHINMDVLPKDALSIIKNGNLHKALKIIYLPDAITVSYWSKVTTSLPIKNT